MLHPNLARDRSLAFSASTSRSRAGALVFSDASRRRALSETSDTARLKASALACDGESNPESLRTNCSAEAWISACVAGGSKLNSVLMLRTIIVSPIPVTLIRTGGLYRGRSASLKSDIAAHFDIQWTPRSPCRHKQNQRVP